MNQAEKIEYVRSFLKERIYEEFHYPFQVLYEDDQFIFRLKSGESEISVRIKHTDEAIACISGGDRERMEEETARLFEILHSAIQAQESMVLIDCGDYEKIKNELILRPLNYHYAQNDLKDVPYIRIGDIALVLYAVIAHAGNDYFTAKMHRSQMEKWKRPEDEVLGAALDNTSHLYPARLYSAAEYILPWNNKKHDDGDFMNGARDLKIKKGVLGYILTTTMEINGAIAMFYPGVAQKIAECLGEDFYISFTSIHEAQVHSASVIPPDVVRSSLRDTNRFFKQKEELLTNQVYCYSLERKSFGVIQDGEFHEVWGGVDYGE